MTAIGIDLGTTNSAAGSRIGDRTEILDVDGDRTMRSAVTFAPGGDEVIVGDMAVEYLETDPGETVTTIKRHMGDDDHAFTTGGDYALTEYTPEMISALVLRKVVQGAEASLGDDVDEAIITVPADFPPTAREATQRAAKLAGVDVMRLLPEPSAACVAYGLRPRETEIEKVAVYDLGGGTFDISIVNVLHEENYFDVQATDGRQRLGGEDFDKELADYVIEEFEADTGVDLSGNHEAQWRVRNAAKNAKHRLSATDSATIREGGLAGENLEMEITRETFEELTGHLVDDTIGICRDLLEAEELTTDDVDTVLLVGGSTKMPQVREAVEEFFGEAPSREVNPDEAVALGAATQAASISDRGIPGAESEEITDKGAELGNVVSRSIGIELADGSFDRIIENNSNLPARAREEREYTTVEDNQNRARIRVFQGEAATAEENDLVDEFILSDIRDAPAGVPEITVEVEVDRDGVVQVRAWDASIVDDPDSDDGAAEGEGSIDVEGSEEPDTGELDRIREQLPSVS